MGMEERNSSGSLVGMLDWHGHDCVEGIKARWL